MAAKKRGQGIAQWPETERPRERLLSQGPHVLTDAQLLAILLRVGRHGSSAVQVGMDILDRLGGVAGLAQCGIEELCAIPGVGKAKSAQLKAALELGKRALAGPLCKGTKLPPAATFLPITIQACAISVTKFLKLCYSMPSTPLCATPRYRRAV